MTTVQLVLAAGLVLEDPFAKHWLEAAGKEGAAEETPPRAAATVLSGPAFAKLRECVRELSAGGVISM